jgi:MoxR-like ATPase
MNTFPNNTKSVERIKAAIKLLDIQDLDVDAVFDSYAVLKKEADKYKKEIASIRSKGITIDLQHRNRDVIKHSWHENLATDVQLGRTVAIIGSSGNGKSYGVKHVLEELGFTIYHMDCTDSVTVDQLVGGITPEPDGVGGIRMVFKEGLFAKAFSDPKAAIQLDEYDALDPRVAMSLQSALHRNAKGRWLSCQDHPDGGIKAAGLCPIVVTMNTFGDGPTREYVGRNSLDAANKDRFDSIITTDYENEEQILVSNGFDPKVSASIVKVANSIRKVINEKALRVILSTRRLINIAECVSALKMSVQGAFTRDFFNRLDHVDKQSFEGFDFLADRPLKKRKEEALQAPAPIGSLIKVIKKGNSHNYKVGQYYVVMNVHGHNMQAVTNGFQGNWIPPDCVTLVASIDEMVKAISSVREEEEEEEEEEENA